MKQQKVRPRQPGPPAGLVKKRSHYCFKHDPIKQFLIDFNSKALSHKLRTEHLYVLNEVIEGLH